LELAFKNFFIKDRKKEFVRLKFSCPAGPDGIVAAGFGQKVQQIVIAGGLKTTMPVPYIFAR
jgi:hypothetical protein